MHFSWFWFWLGYFGAMGAHIAVVGPRNHWLVAGLATIFAAWRRK